MKGPGVGSPGEIGLGVRDDNIYYSVRLTEVEAPVSEADAKESRRWLKLLKRGVIARLRRPATHFIWWQAAKGWCEEWLRANPGTPATVYCVMGHTHVPDTAEARIGGRKCVYFNSGTWTGQGASLGDRKHATYLEVDGSGRVWLQDWIHDRYPGPPS